MTAVVTSHRNPLVRRVKRLQQRKYRRQERAFFVEGPRGFLSAYDAGATMEAIVIAPDLLRSEACLRACDEAAARGVAVVRVSADVFVRLSERDNPAGIGAIVGTPETELSALPWREQGIYVALDEPADPGNVGTVIRTLDAVGAQGLILTGQATDPTHPGTVKASMGSMFSVPFCLVGSVSEVLAWARERHVQVIATSAHARTNYWEAAYRRPLLLLMGSEREGLSQAALGASDLAVTIPMVGSATSLNLAIATSLLLYEVRRREIGP